jgi:hypothetical protein
MSRGSETSRVPLRRPPPAPAEPHLGKPGNVPAEAVSRSADSSTAIEKAVAAQNPRSTHRGAGVRQFAEDLRGKRLGARVSR